ncbi:hypothetical protein HNW77_00380 [Komagataeibacter sp. AV436]|uniref:Uncharacterized protein n=1 Tax=Komagataeibacter melomenusus TaxID=2766578 RepID=A0ABX2AAK6_9PROT|nr:hypothetical protein [Komagataeibacter melomenusus]MBV1829311.1 hypothetical protein [Komagataeibacter melomenusus]NPC64882.1 hypothetical protein [Komagataeibacter melomenusus]
MNIHVPSTYEVYHGRQPMQGTGLKIDPRVPVGAVPVLACCAAHGLPRSRPIQAAGGP